jgi:hypothetical protein
MPTEAKQAETGNKPQLVEIVREQVIPIHLSAAR